MVLGSCATLVAQRRDTGRIDRIEDMGVEEDVIRKTTTPAYRSPEVRFAERLPRCKGY